MTDNIKLPPIAGKVAWLCSYTPEELIRAAGFLPYRPTIKDEDEAQKSGYLPGNLCPYVRSAAHKLLQIEEKDLAGVVIANSCNAMMHLYNMLEQESELSVFLLDLPRQKNEKARNYFADCLQDMLKFLSGLGQKIEAAKLYKTMTIYHNTEKIWQQAFKDDPEQGEDKLRENKFLPTGFIADRASRQAFTRERWKFNRDLREAIDRKTRGNKAENFLPNLTNFATRQKYILTGAQPPPFLSEILTEQGAAVFHDHCQGYRYWQKNYNEFAAEDSGSSVEAFGEAENLSRLLGRLADIYLQKPGCPRFYDLHERQQFYQNLLAACDFTGVIYHNLNFCDFAHYDYLRLKEFFQSQNLPVLNLASELSSGDQGQLRTRIEAFLEMA